MTINFDMHRIGQTIARLRREHNMTQMALADAMGVSFQAVSNWERGQSMPDISKLPELAGLFSTSIDELLGHHSPLIEKAAEGKLEELPTLTVEEVTEAAPLLPPQQMDALTDKLLELSTSPDMEELLPFLSTDKVDEIARARTQAELSIDELLPFMSEDCVDEIARTRAQAGLSIDELLPFLPTSKVDELLHKQLASGDDLSQYAVFASTHAVDEAARMLEQQGGSAVSLLPFMSQAAIDALAEKNESQGQDATCFAPFLSNSALNALVVSRLQQGRSISSLLPFISQDTLQKLFEASTNT